MEKELIRTEEAQKIVKDLNEQYSLEKMQSMIKDNKAEFIYKEVKYLVRMLSQKDKDDLDLLKRKKFSELLQAKDDKGNPSFLMEKEIIKLYKERNIANLDEMDGEIKKLWKEINDLRIKQGKALEDKEPESILKNYDEQLTDCFDNINGIVYQKSIILENSFEKTLEHYIVKVASWLSLQKLEGEQYKRAFDTIDDFLKSDEELITITVSYSLALNHGV